MCHKKVNILLIASVIAVFALLFSALGVTALAAENSGSCGENLTWTFSAGTLTVSGSGDMQNYNEVESAPWKDFSQKINTVILSKDITSIGSFAFFNCTAIKAISIPDKVQNIYEKAFYNCTSLRLVDISDNLTFIGKSAFYNCEKIEAISLPDSLETISEKAFYLCRNITSIVVPQNVKVIGRQAFAYCENLIRVEINTKNITSIPEWCFYGCQNLAQIKLPETVTELGDYAFKRCDQLYTVSYSGNNDAANDIRNQLSKDVPNFENSGFVSYGSMDESTQTSKVENDDDGNFVSQTNTTVKIEENVTIVSEVKFSIVQGQNGKYNVKITMTVDGNDGWTEATEAIRKALLDINNDYSLDGKLEQLKLTLYLKNTNSVNKYFLKELAGRKMTVEVVDSSGSVWCIDCSALERDNIKQDVTVSFVLGEATQKTTEKLGTEDCYQVKFDQNSEINTSVVITLPEDAANTTAFLYQKDWLGRLTMLQATVVDDNSNAHFYVSSINKNTEYIVALNVPDASKENVIIPDEAADPFGAIARLEKIDYVSTGPRKLFGFTAWQIILLAIGILVLIAIVTGVIMRLYNKNKFAVKSVNK